MIIDDDREKHEFQEAWLRKRFITGPSRDPRIEKLVRADQAIRGSLGPSLNQHDSKLEK